jgi:hypothetical protein
MIAKALCLCVSSVAYISSTTEPNTKNPRSKKIEKVTTDGKYICNLHVLHQIFPLMSKVNAVEAMVYILLMVYTESYAGNSSNNSNYSNMTMASQRDFENACQQLLVFKTWQLVATFLSVFGCWLRRWSFHTLDRYFTVRERKEPRRGLFAYVPIGFVHETHKHTLLLCLVHTLHSQGS